MSCTVAAHLRLLKGAFPRRFYPKVIQTFIKLLCELLLPSGFTGTLMVAERELCNIGGPTIPTGLSPTTISSKGLSWSRNGKAYQILRDQTP